MPIGARSEMTTSTVDGSDRLSEASRTHGDASSRVDEDCNGRAVPEPDDGAQIDRLQELPCLFTGDLWGLTFQNGVSFAADRQGRVQDYRMSRHKGVKEMPEGCEVLLASGNAALMVIEIPTDDHRRDLG